MINIIEKKVSELIPYENNARLNDDAVEYVANSIKEFGFKNPVIIDCNNVIVAGHTRVKACEKLGIKKVPCIIADDLTEEQVKAYRLIDNKTNELALWDYEKLAKELEEIQIDMDKFELDWELPEQAIDWENVEELNSNTYKEPEQTLLECPKCHNRDWSVQFRKIKIGTINNPKDEDC